MAKIFIQSKNKEDKKGRKFRTYWTTMLLKVKCEESKGEQEKTITVKFTRDCNDHAKVVRGWLTADLDAPSTYEIKKNDKGEEEYPTVWIKKIRAYDEVPYERNNKFTAPHEKGTEPLVIENDSSEPSKKDDELPF